MRVQNNHAHARTRYTTISGRDYWTLLQDVIDTKKKGYKSLTVHLPFELIHVSAPYANRGKGILFIEYGEFLKRIFNINLYWENAPELIVGTWNRKYEFHWTPIPGNIDLCLDTGHVMLNEKSAKDARAMILFILDIYGPQIKHIHLHENDLVRDCHWKPKKILTKKFIKEITQGRTFIIEEEA